MKLRMVLFVVMICVSSISCQKANQATNDEIYNQLLQTYVDSVGYIKYKQWKANEADVKQLKSYVDSISAAQISSMSADAKKTIYINAYNAMTLDLILSHYEETLGGAGSPLPNQKSIKNIQNLNLDVWDYYKWKLNEQQVSLNELENNLLRPLGDYRIHFAIVCASVGCPPMYRQVFKVENIDSVLEQLTNEFVNSGKKTVFDTDKKIIKTSYILSWFQSDFLANFDTVQKLFSKYVQNVSSQDVLGYSMEYLKYDWQLNESSD